MTGVWYLYSRLTSDPPQDLNVPQTSSMFFRILHHGGIDISDEMYDNIDRAYFAEPIFDYLLIAQAHKLAAMLALTDQITYESAKLNSPINHSFIPESIGREWKSNWQEVFGEELPGIGDLYVGAHQVLLDLLGNKDVKMLEHIIKKPKLLQLT